MDKDKVKNLLAQLGEAMGDEEKVEKKEEDKTSKVEGTFDVEKLVAQLGEKITAALKESKGHSAADQQSLKDALTYGEDGLLSKEVSADMWPKMETVARWKKTYNETVNPDEKKAASNQLIVNFFKSWVRHRFDPEAAQVFKALNEGTDADGGYLVPTPLATEVFRVLPDFTVMRNIARTIPMTRQSLNLNTLVARPSAYWVAEYAKKTTTSIEFGQGTLTVNKLVCLLPVTDELLADANISVANFVIELFAETIGATEDRAFFIGSGSGQPRGINQESLTTVNYGASIGFDNIIDLIYSVPQAARRSRRTAFVGNSYMIEQLRKVKDSNNNYIWRDGGMMGGETRDIGRTVATLYGYKFYEQNDIAQKNIYFGDWGMYLIGDRQQIRVKSTQEGGDSWRRDSTEYKAVERVDGRAILTSPFAVAQP